jgi:hypothetical protein
MINTTKRTNHSKRKKGTSVVCASCVSFFSPLVNALFNPGRAFHRSHPLAAVTNILLIESIKSSATAALAVHVVISSSFQWDKAAALAYGTWNVLVQGAGPVTGGTTYCKEGFIVHLRSNDSPEIFPKCYRQIANGP